jgi:hypothetical protein
VCADAGGSSGYRIRAWKVELAKLAKETGLEITVCHYPPGTSKWNKIVLYTGFPGVVTHNLLKLYRRALLDRSITPYTRIGAGTTC